MTTEGLQGLIPLLVLGLSVLSAYCVYQPGKAILSCTAAAFVLMPVLLLMWATGEDWYSRSGSAWHVYVSARPYVIALGALAVLGASGAAIAIGARRLVWTIPTLAGLSWVPVLGFFLETQH